MRRYVEDAGSTIVTVLVVMLVLTVGGLALASIMTNSTVSLADSSSRSQAQAAVDAGIAEQTTRIETGAFACGIVRSDYSGEDLPVNGAGSGDYDYELSCEAGVATLSVTSVVGGADSSRQSVFSYTVTPGTSAEEALITKAPLNLSSLQITAADPSRPATAWVVPEAGGAGDFTCTSGGKIEGSVYLPAGAVLGSGGCTVTGDIYAQGNVSISSGTTIGGNVVSLEGNITISGGNSIAGNAYAKNNISGSSLSRRMVGNIHAGGNLSLGGGSPTARGNITYGGTFTHGNPSAHSSWADGAAQKLVVDPLPLPERPEWQTVTQADIDALPYNTLKWTGDCGYKWWPVHEMIATIQALTAPTVIDARHCATLDLHEYSGTTLIKTDIVFVAPSFVIEDQKFQSGDGNTHRLWFISPEEEGRNCAAAPSSINIDGSDMLPLNNSKISAMIYTQCSAIFPNSGEGWQGSVQAGKLEGKPNFRYNPVGFPGDPDPVSGSSPATPGAATNWALVSSHDVEPASP